jgi:Uma2 family endonuclease
MPSKGNAWPLAPDLAIEFISPSEFVDDMIEKLEDYFDAGVRQVWVVHPRRRLVQVYESLLLAKGLREPAELTGGDILPSFRVPVARLFAPKE